MRGLSVAAIVLGGVVDVLLSSGLGMLLVFQAFYTRGFNHVPKEQLQGAISSLMHGDAKLYVTQTAIGLGASVIGGFVAASIAKQRRLLNGVLASWLCIGIGIVSILRRDDATPAAIHAALIAATPMCYLAGATIRLKLSRSVVA
jgi:hypothetical protein